MATECVRIESNKVRETKTRITDALFSLLENESIERITVAQVCALAKVNRSTFYNHFADIYDVREQCEQEIAIAVETVLPRLMTSIILGRDNISVDMIESYLGPHFDQLGVLLGGGDPHFLDRIHAIGQRALLEILHRDSFSEQQEYAFAAVAGMQLNLIRHWLQTGRSMALPDLIDYMRKLITQGPRAVILSHNR
ncbi:MAG: TetR/AcrR family transcriptional regulator [Raoultibacter sp.]